MIGVIVALGAVGTTIALALLFGKKKDQIVPPRPPNPDPGKDDEKKTEKDEGEDPDDGGGSYEAIAEKLDKWKAKVGDIWNGGDDPDDDRVDPPPEPPVGPDPYAPSPHPTPGQYYQVVKTDTLWAIQAAAHGSGAGYPAIVAAPENTWLRKPPAATWKGGLYAKYSGWNTVWLSGTQYPVIYIP